MLASVDYGKGPPIVILHGLFGSGRNWTSVAKRLAASHRVFTVDLRNHGASPWAETMSYRDMAEDVCDFIRARGLGPIALMGHSMGGKVAMVAALSYPGLAHRLVVVDIAPVDNPPTLLAYVQAMRAVDLARVTRRSEVDALLAPVIQDAAERQFLLQNLAAENGKLAWRLNLEAIERNFPDIIGFPETGWERAYAGPVLFVAGGRSTYVRPEHEEAIRRLFLRAQVVRIPDAGHWVHAERPDAFLAAVAPFLNGT
jgi:pimeloyl-ACP methyl ester carboxylesterase